MLHEGCILYVEDWNHPTPSTFCAETSIQISNEWYQTAMGNSNICIVKLKAKYTLLVAIGQWFYHFRIHIPRIKFLRLYGFRTISDWKNIGPGVR